MFQEKNGKLYYICDGEIVCIEAWGDSALRVRSTRNRKFTEHDWALDIPRGQEAHVQIFEDQDANGTAYANMYMGEDKSYGEISNGKIKAVINANGVVTFFKENGEILLKENWRRLQDEISAPLNIYGREYVPQEGENYKISLRFLANDQEKIYGMGQYQQTQMNMKGCMLELAQRNSQVSVPFYISSLGYGFLWNNPAVGSVFFGMNGTEWRAESTKQIDYLVIAGDTPAEIEENYMDLTGRAPMMPEYGLGFWQCKLRYRTQEELLQVARRYYQEKIPVDVIIADFFHWTQEGDFRFDPKYWPDVPAMCKELEEMGMKLMVSVWPTVDYRSENFAEMKEKGYLIQCEKGVRISMLCGGNEVFFDATNPEARKFVWDKIKKNYWDKGAKLFWLDVAEPEYTTYQFENYRYYLGTNLEVGNSYPKFYTQGFFDGMTEEGDKQPINLVRSAWAGSAKYGALVWSGDIVSNFECFNRQVRAGLSMAIAGIPWWTTDIGGLHGARGDDPAFRELFIRWFAYGCFSPVMRLHGNRNPQLDFEGEAIGSGSANEIWSFGEEVFKICKKYIALRERMRPYMRAQMRLVHEKGTPVMRPYFYDYPEDKKAWEIEDSYLFGTDFLVAPVLEAGAKEREVYLPKGEVWIDVWTGEERNGGETITVATPLEQIPVFAKKGSKYLEIFDNFS
ncbi:MAG: glycoside hydrolase family 31 protein [Firmicutes bacterium]|nr:glycoside hydrolase family 31 protein [Bacillota bacterium]